MTVSSEVDVKKGNRVGEFGSATANQLRQIEESTVPMVDGETRASSRLCRTE
jgi:hypothetical protein